jgi:actin-related protein 10
MLDMDNVEGYGASGSGVAASVSADDSTEFDVPPSEASHQPSESGVSSPPPSSAFSGYTSTRTGHRSSGVPGSEAHLQGIATMYSRHSTATDLKLRVDPPTSQNTGTGKGTLVIPGWIRERAAEVLFEGGDVDESSVAEVILDSLLKVSCGCSQGIDTVD